MSWVFDHSPITVPGERLVLLALANHADAFGYGAFPSKRKLGEETRIHPKHVQKILRRLEGYGAIEQVGVSRWGTHDYRIIMGGEQNAPGEHQAVGGERERSPGGSVGAPQTITQPSYEPPIHEAQEAMPIALSEEERKVHETLTRIAEANNAKRRPSVDAVIRVMRKFPDRDHAGEAEKMETYVYESGHKVKSPTSMYDGWLGRAKPKTNKEERISVVRQMEKELGW